MGKTTTKKRKPITVSVTVSKETESNDGFLSNQNNQIEYYGLHGVM
ncbi:hypothetical protein P9D39_06475 [Heyndrickxia oleronia]|nr:hypothetical protein [Heyndrickxia oleronia]MEC1373949.1 hypothetical protein [Heyndrickxia oleronia]QQZ03577.1 hypothetical protein I5818_17705 [Heyndrickxia oleronia]